MKPSLAFVAVCFATASCVCVCSQEVIAAEVPGIAKEVISTQHADNSDPRSAISRMEPTSSKAISVDKSSAMERSELKEHAISLQHNDLSAPNAATAQQSNDSLNSTNSNRSLPNRSQTVIRSRSLQDSSQDQ